MRIWDLNPGYLNRQSLLGEHRELHGIVSIITNNKKGYSKHPETLRWSGYGWALTARHKLLSAEMELRNFNERSPVNMNDNKGLWPPDYIDEPVTQLHILAKKYLEKEKGRIFLPQTAQQLWSHHKYSILARDVVLYKKIGRTVAGMSPDEDFSSLFNLLTKKLHFAPSAGGIRNAIQHMWGHVAAHYSDSREIVSTWSLHELFDNMQKLAVKINEPYLMNSTALSELKIWI
ncbi:MAG: hypothetical protein CSB21_02935 [Deltaproteobacteria bacterium]|nr:MAG: hypothetical protein CSB21_02935 [Deltaproteobacteria bacterium]